MTVSARFLLVFGFLIYLSTTGNSDTIPLSERTRDVSDEGVSTIKETTKDVDSKRLALIICDVWDVHTSKNATLRTGELAPHVNQLANAIREQGGTVIHCPSGCMEFYADHPARRAAQTAPPATNLPAHIGEWCESIPSEKGVPYPLDQSDGGQDDDPETQRQWEDELKSMGRKTRGPWIRQHPGISIEDGDYISDQGDEVWNILEDKQVETTLIAGVHTNMCVLGRPFGLRRLAENGRHVLLVRDLTDTMYNPNRRPFVSHFTGTDRIVSYIEQTVCPTIASSQILGGDPFQFKGDHRQRLALIMSEPEYRTAETLSAFASRHLGDDFKILPITQDPDDDNRLVGLEQLGEADVMLLSVRRRALPTEQLDTIQGFIRSGKPVVGIRTASHAFSLRNASPPDGHGVWDEFDAEILGGNYTGHHANDLTTDVHVAEGRENHTLLTGVDVANWTSQASLYEVRPLKKSTTAILIGQVPDAEPEPVAWTNQTQHGGKVVYLSLGHEDDFANSAFRKLLLNSLCWVTDQPIPENLPDSTARANQAKLDELRSESSTIFTTPEDVVWEPVLAEPDIGQPLYIEFDERGRMWVAEYRQYPYPAGLKMLSKDKFWRAVYDRLPEPPPTGTPGADRISIHEDTNGDGTYDKHSIFVDGLNIASSFARGRGGLFVLNPPYLLYYADKNNDDQPDGDPEVLLEGFGLEDTHSVANSLRFGPDGWLYGCQGSTVSGQVKRYETDDKPVPSMGQLIWRYHPERKVYEIFAEGGGNAFGLEIDASGNIYSGHNGGNTRGFHYIPNGYYRKGFEKHGPLSNPHTYGFYEPMANEPVQRFTHDFVIYEGDNLPERYHGKLFAVEPLQGQLTHTKLIPNGSTFGTEDIDRIVKSVDGSKFRPVHIATGPDGAMYVADFHEEHIDHLNHFQGKIEKETGRIYRLCGVDGKNEKSMDRSKLSSSELLQRLNDPNRWERQLALRLLFDNPDAKLIEPLRQSLVMSSADDANLKYPLDHLWALNALGGLDTETVKVLLQSANPLVRLWTIRLAIDREDLDPEMVTAIVDSTPSEKDVRVQVQLACSARKLPAEDSLRLLGALISTELNLDDPFLPLAIWWGFEQYVDANAGDIVHLFQQPTMQTRPIVAEFLLERIVRRLASGTRKQLALCGQLIGSLTDPSIRAVALKGFEEAMRGRDSVSLPEELVLALNQSGDLPLSLRLLQGDADALAEAIRLVSDSKTPEATRIDLAQRLGASPSDAALAPLMNLFQKGDSVALRQAALYSLAAYGDDQVGSMLIELFPKRSPAEQIGILSLLVSRVNWADQLLSGIEAGDVESTLVPIDLAQRLTSLGQENLSERAKLVWPELDTAATGADRTLEELQQIIAGGTSDPYTGKRLFQANCGRCHKLFGDGEDVGPDLTSDPRSDLARLIPAINQPSGEIREGFEGYTVVTDDGRVLNGLLVEQDEHVVVLKEADGRDVVIPKSEIIEQVRQSKSLMPDGLLKSLSDQDVRDLFAYLRSSQPLNN